MTDLLRSLQTLGLGQTATIVLQVQHGRGQHTMDLEEEHFDHMLMVRLLLIKGYHIRLTPAVHMDQYAHLPASKLASLPAFIS